MRLLSAKSRITIGLACLLVSVLCTAMMIGVVPERRSAVQAGRGHLCETIAMVSSDYISRGELRRLEHLMQLVVERNSEILSVGVRQADGVLMATVGDHEWTAEANSRSTDSHVHVPIRSGAEKWGSIEIRFRPLGTPGVLGWIESPWVRMTVFVTAACYLLFLIYLRKMLAHLDPSQTVPNRVRSALDSLAEGLLVIDRNQRIVLANKSFANWVGRDPEKLIGVSAANLKWVKNENGDPLEQYPWEEAIRLEAPQAGVILGLANDNKLTQNLIANASPVLGHDSKYRGVLVSFDDVTQLESTKKDLRVAKQVADEANQAKSDFLAHMSHEIRTPMNAILGYTDVLRRGFDETTKERQEYLNTIHTSGEHLLALINDILDLSKIEAGRMELELVRSSPHRLIHQVASVLRGKADEKGISLNIRFDTPMPETILIDGVRLHQAIMNLAGNAIKFTATGGVTIAARMIGTDTSGAVHAPTSRPQLAIDIIDTGIGMPKAVQERVFEPFAQADSSVTRRFGGTGLGLAISKQLAEALGGGIAIRSEEGQGSTFTLTVDVGSLDGIEMIDAQTALAATARDESQSQDLIQLPPARILAVDDGDSNRKLIHVVLSRAGVEVVSVENGQLAVDRALSEPFDVVLMDMQMPVMDGYLATRTLRDAGYELPIIAMTAHAMRGDEEKCREAGCSGFLTKPIKIDLLLATLRNVLAERDQASVPKSLMVPKGPDPADLPTAAVESHRHVRETDQSAETETRETLPDIGPIRCSLPLDDSDFLEIAEEFMTRLKEQLTAMCQACSQNDDVQLAQLAHWLKGSGGTAGFDAFTEPAFELEKAAKAEQRDRYEALIAHLIQIASHVELPAPDCG